MRTPPMFLDTREEWFEQARAELETVIASRHLFSADDLRLLLPTPGHANWWGVLFGAERNAGRIKPMGYTISRSKTRKGGVIRVWAQVIEHKEDRP